MLKVSVDPASKLDGKINGRVVCLTSSHLRRRTAPAHRPPGRFIIGGRSAPPPKYSPPRSPRGALPLGARRTGGVRPVTSSTSSEATVSPAPRITAVAGRRAPPGDRPDRAETRGTRHSAIDRSGPSVDVGQQAPASDPSATFRYAPPIAGVLSLLLSLVTLDGQFAGRPSQSNRTCCRRPVQARSRARSGSTDRHTP